MSVNKFIRKEVLDLKPYHLESLDGIKLNQNESPWDIPVTLKTEVIEVLLKTPWNRYPLGDGVQLKKKMAKKLNLWPDNLVLANGSNVLIQAILLATSVGKTVMVLDPSFGVYESQATLLENKVVKIPLEDDFSISRTECVKLIKKEKPQVIFLPNPNAPTGNLFNLNIVQTIIETAPSLVVVDEAYYPFSGSTILSWIRQYDNLVVLRTFSKAMALGGLRFGWLATEPEVARQIEKCLLPFCLSRLTLLTASTVIDNMGYVDEYANAICKERDRVFKELEKIRGVIPTPSKTNFILFKLPNAKFMFKQFVESGIIVRDVGDDNKLRDSLRVTIGTPEENNAFLSVLNKLMGTKK